MDIETAQRLNISGTTGTFTAAELERLATAAVAPNQTSYDPLTLTDDQTALWNWFVGNITGIHRLLTEQEQP